MARPCHGDEESLRGSFALLKVCIVSSCGGHLTEVRCLRPAYVDFPHFYVLNDVIALPEDMRGITYFVRHAERNFLVAWNCIEAFVILRRERPTVILSTGAGPLVPFSLVGRMFGVRTVFVETMTRVSRPSLTGFIMAFCADRIYYQWEPLGRYFPRGVYCGPLI